MTAPHSRLRRIRLGPEAAIEVLRATEPDARFAPHWHAEWSIGAIRAGHCDFVFEGSQHRAAAGELVVMPPWSLHAALAAADAFAMAMYYVPSKDRKFNGTFGVPPALAAAVNCRFRGGSP